MPIQVQNTTSAVYRAEPQVPAGGVLDISNGFLAKDVMVGTTGGGAATVSVQAGVNVEDQTKGGTNIGVRSNVSAGTNKYNFFAPGTAPNVLGGGLTVSGAITGTGLSSSGTISATALIHSAQFVQSGINYQAITGSASIQVAGTDTHLILDPGAATGACTITFAASPVNGQRLFVSSSNVITAAVFVTAAGIIRNGTWAPAAGGQISWIFRSANTCWFRG